ncbi:MAG: tRNA lysidine(34) synthetase TilS [bacterium]|nr:tRNA lysidine(34) synthetase TilS [Mycoplasmatota bacterium]MDD6757468.1 tRNA lysidine(34) synthetase TilS [bacterium]MDY2908844.1 tRNA lysidine(34) synthetase TilS [Candidatus Faecimonas sp.]
MLSIEDNFVFHKEDTIVVGCSAGPDSMALIDMLLRIREKYSLNLIVAHVNHNLRKQSVQEEEYLRNYCEKKKVMFECMMITEYGDDNFHNEARNIRYDFFEKVVYKYHANYLMTAHHGDDLVETVLMRITRGSNLNGYSGFKKIVDKGEYKIVRPLLSYTKQELEDYDKKNHIMYYIDDSNAKDKYTRNRYRKYVLPFLKEEDCNIHLKYLKFSTVLNEANQFIEHERDKALKKVINNNILKIDIFKELDSFIQKEILYYMMNDFYQDDLILINDKHIELLLNLIYSNRANAFVNLPNEVIATKTYQELELKKVTTEITTYEVELSKYVLLPNHHVIEEVADLVGSGNDTCRLLSSEINLPLTVRTRKFGDRMSIKGNGTKKIKDIFIDKKVSSSERDLWPVVVDSKGVVVWLPGLKKSKYDKKKTEKYDIILRYS